MHRRSIKRLRVERKDGNNKLSFRFKVLYQSSLLPDMRFSSILVVSATFICLDSSSAIPTELRPRAAGTQSDPIPITIDCTNAVDVCNADCYSILCFGAPNPVQYILGNNNRGSDGNNEAALRLVLQSDEQKRQARGINISQKAIDSTGTSPEETVMNNAEEGGEGEIMMPTQPRENTCKYLFPTSSGRPRSLERRRKTVHQQQNCSFSR